MKTKRPLLFCYFFFLSLYTVCAQTTIEGSILNFAALTLDQSPIVKQNNLLVNQAEANYRTQKSIFDYELSSGFSLSRNKLTLFDADPRSAFLSEKLETNTTGLSFGLQKRFRTGLIANISTDYSGISDNFPLDRFNQQVGADISNHATSTTLSLTQPLLRGNRKSVVTAFEKAAQLTIESTKENNTLNNAFEILQMGTAYWQYVGAYESLKIFEANESRVRNVLDITQELVKADKRPEGDLLQIQADLADQERQTTAAKQNFYNAKLNLGRVVGISEVESKTIGNPLDRFPTTNDQTIQVGDMIALARKKRTDISAVQRIQEGLDLQRKAARNSKLPQLDLTGFFTYRGEASDGGVEQFFSALGNRQGRNQVAGLSLNFFVPVNNNRAKADFALSEIAVQDQQITYDNLVRNIDLNVSIALNNLENTIVIVKKAKESLDFSSRVFENEQVRFRNGLTTLLNLILFQDRLTFAHLEYLRAEQQYAVALLNLRFETGTLLTKNDANTISSLQQETFYTIPNNN
ncbi:TolC family protein [uncultured Dokdonia sp.]|uniref:TolC family protein n=1 Tax=uncultured Dokdonia sp. TaxID=575653 RepID=UPI00262A6EF9|nr:TolC family protein [uncultured Dokdonia sp.]